MFPAPHTKHNETKSHLHGKNSLSQLAEFRLDDVGGRIADLKVESRNDINYVKYNVSARIPAGYVAE
jgi:hypothetical protein